MGVKTRILVVDNEPAFRFSVCVALRQSGYDVGEAGTGREALEKLLEARQAGEPFSLVVKVLRIPGLGVMKLMDEIERLGLALPVLSISGFGEEGLRKELEARGLTEFLARPFQPRELLARIALLLEKPGRGAD